MRLIISFFALSFCLPKLVYRLLLAMYNNRSVEMYSQTVVGVNMQCFNMKIFKASNRPLVNVDLWFHYLKGNIDLVGPKILTVKELDVLTKPQRRRFDVAPGLISPFDVKKKSGIAYGDEADTAVEFAGEATNLRRIQIMLAAMVHKLMGNGTRGLIAPSKFSLFGVSTRNVSMSGAIELLMKHVNKPLQRGGASQFAFVNADCVNKYIKNDRYKRTLNKCHSVFADGIGMRIAARWHKARLLGNVNGTDMFPLLCQEMAMSGKSLFLYGGSELVIKETVKRLNLEYPQLKIAGYLDGFKYHDKPQFVCEAINASQANLLMVALGAPQQECWIDENIASLDVSAAIGVGGLFDFYSESVSRAPSWMREMSLEWVWRLLMQPQEKAKRYLLGNPIFLFRVLFSKSNQSQLNLALEVS